MDRKPAIKDQNYFRVLRDEPDQGRNIRVVSKGSVNYHEGRVDDEGRGQSSQGGEQKRFDCDSYKFNPKLRVDVLSQLKVKPTDIVADLFANYREKQELMYMTRKNSAWWYDWSKLSGDGKVL